PSPWTRRSLPASSPSAYCSATSALTPPTCSSSIGSCWRPSSSSPGWDWAARPVAARVAGTFRSTTVEVMKHLRQRAIRDLVEQRAIRTQQELAAALRDRGFRATQATVSRDVADLGLIKVSRDRTQAYALPPRLVEADASGEDRLRKLLAGLPAEFHEAGLLLIVRTLPGSAHAIAAALDRARWPE